MTDVRVWFDESYEQRDSNQLCTFPNIFAIDLTPPSPLW
jgi:hypothetical protein